MRDLTTVGKVHSVAVPSDGFYGFAQGVWAGVPVRTTEYGSYEVIRTNEMDEFAKSKLAITNEELTGERETIKDLLQA